MGIHWWNKDLQILRSRVRSTRKRMQKAFGADKGFLKAEYNRLKALFRMNIIQTKREFWQDLCSYQNIRNPFGIPFKLARGKIGRRFSLSPVWKDKYKGELTNTVEESLVTLMKEHFLDDDELEDSLEQRRIQELMDVCMDMRDLNFTLDEVQDVFKLVNFNSSPGMDGLDMKIIQKLFEVNPVLFVDLLNKCLMDGIFRRSRQRF